MKKTGQFFFTFVPLLLTLALQELLMLFLMGISALCAGSFYTTIGGANLFDTLYELWASERFSTYMMVAYAISCIAIYGLWYYAKYDGNYLPDTRKVFHPLSFVGILMLVPGLQYLSNYIVAFTASIFPHALDTYEELIETAGLDDTLSIGMFLYSVILAPISEELMFRGVTLRQARKCLPFWAANLFQAILFGIFHMNLIQGVYAFFLALFLGYVCEKSGSIYNSVLLHMLFNFWGTVLSQYFYIGDSLSSFLIFFVFAVAMCVGGIAVFNTGVLRSHPAVDNEL
jgi:membrane protease YdiL (CAAX protease family)